MRTSLLISPPHVRHLYEMPKIAKFRADIDFLCRRYLTTAQVLELAGAGFEFGAHSVSHPYFNGLTIEDQRDQITGSVHFIRELGLPCRCFAFPLHDCEASTSLFRYMTDLGVVLSFGTSEARVDSIVFSFQRFAPDAENSRSSYRQTCGAIGRRRGQLRH